MKLNQESHTRAAASDGNLEPETVSLAQQTRQNIWYNQKDDEWADKGIESGGDAEDAPDFMQLMIVKRILKYENDRGGRTNAIDFKILETIASDPGEITVADHEEQAKGGSRCLDREKTRNGKSAQQDSAQEGIEGYTKNSTTNEQLKDAESGNFFVPHPGQKNSKPHQNSFKNRQVYIEKDAKINYEKFTVKNYGKRNEQPQSDTSQTTNRLNFNSAATPGKNNAKNFQNDYEIDHVNNIGSKDPRGFDWKNRQLRKQGTQQMARHDGGHVAVQDAIQEHAQPDRWQRGPAQDPEFDANQSHGAQQHPSVVVIDSSKEPRRRLNDEQ